MISPSQMPDTDESDSSTSCVAPDALFEVPTFFFWVAFEALEEFFGVAGCPEGDCLGDVCLVADGFDWDDWLGRLAGEFPDLTNGDGPVGLILESSAALLIACDFDRLGFGEFESWIKSIWLSSEEPSLRAMARRTAESEADRGTPPLRPVRAESKEVSSRRLLTVSLKGLPLDLTTSSISSIDIPFVGLIEIDGFSAWYF